MRRKKITIPLLILCALVLAVCIGYLIDIGLKKKHSEEVTANAIQEITQTQESGEEEFWYDHEAALKINPDAKGLLWIPSTGQKLPIVQRLNDENNDYYLHRGFDGDYSWAGTIYIDTNIEEGLDALNVLIYGHHMGDHTMFSDNDKYRDEGFYRTKGNDTFYIYTPDSIREYKIFSAFTYPKSGEVFTIGMTTKEQVQKYAVKCKNLSFYDTNVDISNTSQVVTLVSCDVKSNYVKRMIIQGALIKETDMTNVIKKHKEIEK